MSHLERLLLSLKLVTTKSRQTNNVLVTVEQQQTKAKKIKCVFLHYLSLYQVKKDFTMVMH